MHDIETNFARKSRLLSEWMRGEDDRSFDALAATQRHAGEPSISFAGGRVDHVAGVQSSHVGLLHCALPEGYPKATRPAFHGDHDEMIVCTHGRMAVEFARSREPDAPLERIALGPGEWVVFHHHWPHRFTIDEIASLASVDPALAHQRLAWSFV